jgi:type I restriction enzyme R subunit
LRAALLTLQARDEQIIDTVSKDTVLAAGWDTQAREAARQTVTSFRQFLDAHKDEIMALQIFYSQPRRAPLTENDLKQLAAAIAAPPLGLTTDKLWQAYETLNPERVRKSTGYRRLLTDLVSLLRYTMVHDLDENATLEPYRETIERRFASWLDEQEQRRGAPFAEEQLLWLQRMRDTIASSLTIERDDFGYEPFLQLGGLGKATELFGKDLAGLLNDLNERLAA